MKKMPAGKFKTHCLRVMEEVKGAEVIFFDTHALLLRGSHVLKTVW